MRQTAGQMFVSTQGPAVAHYSAVLAEAVYSSERPPPSLDFPLLHATKIPPSTTVRFHFLPRDTTTDAYSKNIALLARPGSWMPRGTDQLPCNPIARTHPAAAAQLDDSGPPAGQSTLPHDRSSSGGAQGTRQIDRNVNLAFRIPQV